MERKATLLTRAASIPVLQALINYIELPSCKAAPRYPTTFQLTTFCKMSFDQLSSTEAQPTSMRRNEDPEYQDDPEFSRFAEDLSVKLFTLTSNISRLSQQISLLGTKRDTERVRERVHDLLEEARDGFKEVGDGIKKLTAWDDLNVGHLSFLGSLRGVQAGSL